MLERVRGGISIEDPCMFAYGGRYYYFVAMISNPDKSIGAQNLDNKHIKVFEYTNEINSLCLYGSIVYTDLDGTISKYVNRMDNHIEIACQQMEKVSDGGMESYRPMKRSDGAEFFAHSFIVQNISINREPNDHQAITYKITLISTAWYLLCSKITFSNYDPNGTEPKNGYLILNKFLSDALAACKDTFKVDSTSFIECSKDVNDFEILYITNGNDNIFTAKKYIFDKMYWSNKNMDKSLKYIAYSPAMSLYRCIDYNKSQLWFPCEKPYVLYSLFETDYEQHLFSIGNSIRSVAKKNQTSTLEDLFEHKVWKMDPKTGIITSDKFSLSQERMSEIYNNKTIDFENMIGVKTDNKYQSKLRTDWFKNDPKSYCLQTSEWNKDFYFYDSIVENMMDRDAIVVGTEGDLTHQPGTCLGIVLDRTMEKLPELTAKEKDELYRKHRQLEGMFPVLKAQHIYHLANSPEEPVFYRENLVLARNFILPPKS